MQNRHRTGHSTSILIWSKRWLNGSLTGLMQDMRITQIRVQIEKPEAIAGATSVGIAISRLRG